MVLLIISALTILYWALVVPESPQWQYTWSQFSSSRKNLRDIASFNGLPEEQQEKLKRLRFDFEKPDQGSERGDEAVADGADNMEEVINR